LYSGNVMSVSMYFMFLWVFQWEVYGCVGRGWLPQYVNFKIRIFPDNKVTEAYNPVAFMSRFELYVCVYLVYAIVDKFGVCPCGVTYD